MMLSFLSTVIMLTSLFSITAGLAFIFRKSALKGKESGMYYIWLAVIIFALVPVRIGEPRIILFPQENSRTQTDNTDAQNNTVKLSELISYMQRPVITDDITDFNANEHKDPATAEISTGENIKNAKSGNIDILQFISDNRDILILGAVIIWLAGFIFMTAKTIYGYFKMKKLFYKESDICADDRVNRIFRECLEIVGLTEIRRRIDLRIMKWNFSSPCVCGLLNPAVIIDCTCASLNDKKLKYVFIHELYHIKRYDMLYKILSVIAAGTHWFNPLTYKVVKTMSEDCELSVDKCVMRECQNEQGISLSEQSDYYMNIILDIAEQKYSENNKPLPLSKIPSASLFFGEPRNIKFLKRRYDNMKNIINKKQLIIALSVFLAVIISMNTIIMSSCGIIGEAADAAGQPYINTMSYCPDANIYEAALRLYFGLLPDEPITQEQLDEITDIKIVKGINVKGTTTDSINGVELGSMTPVSFVVNGREFNMVPSIVHRRYFEDYINKKFAEAFPSIDEVYNMAREQAKLNAYYTIKDLNAPDLEPRARAELLLEYPIAAEFPIAVFDENASEREYMQILSYFAAVGLLDDNFVQNDTIDAAYLCTLSNLETVTLANIAAKNLDLLPDTVNVVNEEYPVIDINDDTSSQAPSSQPLSGVFEAPNYGINIIENYYGIPDGTEYLEFKNESLRCAIAEYFNVSDGNYIDFIPWNPITLDMLSQITSINVRRIPEYDFVFDHPEAQIPLKGMYLEYTINGKTLDILPETYRIEGEQFFEMASLNILDYCDKIYDGMYGEDSYHFLTKSDIPESDKLSIVTAMAKLGLARIAIYQNDDGSYFTVGRPDLFGFTARYYDQPEYDSTDIAYMPNLTEFTLDGISAK